MTNLIQGALAACALGVIAAPVACFADPGTPPAAESAPTPPTETTGDKIWAIHVQATDVLQYKPAFRSPYQGTNSLTGAAETSNTVNASFFAGLQPWKGGQFWFDLDMNQGFAPSNTLGVAGFVNGEGAKVGHHSPYYRPQRLFFRQTIDLGGGDDKVDPDLFEFGGKTTKNRVVITLGKFSLTDVMDDNAYAHDPQNDFLNWAIIDTGSFDYAADAWGFSYGGVAEWYQGAWTLRGGVMDAVHGAQPGRADPGVPPVPAGWRARAPPEVVRPRGQDQAARLHQPRPDGQLRRRYRAGRTHRRDAPTRPSCATTPPDPASRSTSSSRSATTPACSCAPAWTRASTSPTSTPTSTETVAAGGSIAATRWGRKDDTVALALVVNGISKQHEAYLAAGGLGILVGDGRLPHPGAESHRRGLLQPGRDQGRAPDLRQPDRRQPGLQPRPRPGRGAGAAPARPVLTTALPPSATAFEGQAAPTAARRAPRRRRGRWR